MAQAAGRVNQAELIKQHIASEREVLRSEIRHLERRVRSATDWRTWVARKPLLLLGLAFGGGFYLSLKAGR